MRTTVTLDPDVAAKVKAEMKRSDLTFKQALNKLVRSSAVEEKKAPYNPFRGWAWNMGLDPKFNWDSTSEILNYLDDLEFEEKKKRGVF